MNKSDSIQNLAVALNQAQAEFIPAPLNSSNPHLRNRYADLGSIIESTKPILAKYGLSVSQMVSGVANEIGVTTLLMHTSGEWLESSVLMPILEQKGINHAQVAGSIISYLRRYSLAAALGIYSGDDDDASSIVKDRTQKPANAPRPQDLPKDLPKLKEKPAENGKQLEKGVGAQGYDDLDPVITPDPFDEMYSELPPASIPPKDLTKPASWPKVWLDTLIHNRYADSVYEAAGMLSKSDGTISPSRLLTPAHVGGWGKHYRMQRDEGDTPEAAAIYADGKLADYLKDSPLITE